MIYFLQPINHIIQRLFSIIRFNISWIYSRRVQISSLKRFKIEISSEMFLTHNPTCLYESDFTNRYRLVVFNFFQILYVFIWRETCTYFEIWISVFIKRTDDEKIAGAGVHHFCQRSVSVIKIKRTSSILNVKSRRFRK